MMQPVLGLWKGTYLRHVVERIMWRCLSVCQSVSYQRLWPIKRLTQDSYSVVSVMKLVGGLLLLPDWVAWTVLQCTK